MASLLYRLGAFSARHRIVTVVGWLCVAGALLVGFASGMSHATQQDSANNSGSVFSIPGAESSQAMQTLRAKFPEVASASNVDPGAESLSIVVQAPAGQQMTTPDNINRLLPVVSSAASVDHVAAVANPLDPQQPYVSPDQTTAVIGLTLSGVTPQNAGQIEAGVNGLADQLRQAGFTAEVGGELVQPDVKILGPLEAIGAGFAFLILLLALRSVLGAGINMLTAAAGVGVGVLGAYAYGALIKPIGPLTPALAVMLGLALGIDYGLFILTRYRAELREGHRVTDAIGRAVASAGSSVLVAGLTVITAVAALAVIGIPMLTELGLAAAFAVGIDVLFALTLVPAMLGFLGHRALTRRERTAAATVDVDTPESGTKVSLRERWAAAVVRRRVTSLLAGVLALGVLAIPAAGLHTALNTPGGTNPASSERAAYNLIQQKFGGVQSPLVVLAEGTGVPGSLDAVSANLQRLSDVEYVIPGATNGTSAYLTVIPDGGPNDQSTKDLVASIRSVADRTAGVHLSVTGETAIGIDSDAQLRHALLIYIGLIVAICLVLLIILFRSLLVPVVAAAGFLLSLGASLGVTVAVFQWGWFGSVLPSDVGNPLMSFLPILVTGILFGLAMDYQVFLVSRIAEAHRRGMRPGEAIVDGFGRSAPVVAAAAAIMTFVFGGFAGSAFATMATIAFGLAVGVAVDAFVVRMVLVPAALSVLGRAAWWLPRWLDRILPHIDHEGVAAVSPVDSRPLPALTPEPVSAADRG
jgi:RND superfamily putative drug exporter